jgi:hypothetical protein
VEVDHGGEGRALLDDGEGVAGYLPRLLHGGLDLFADLPLGEHVDAGSLERDDRAEPGLEVLHGALDAAPRDAGERALDVVAAARQKHPAVVHGFPHQGVVALAYGVQHGGAVEALLQRPLDGGDGGGGGGVRVLGGGRVRQRALQGLAARALVVRRRAEELHAAHRLAHVALAHLLVPGLLAQEEGDRPDDHGDEHERRQDADDEPLARRVAIIGRRHWRARAGSGSAVGTATSTRGGSQLGNNICMETNVSGDEVE